MNTFPFNLLTIDMAHKKVVVKFFTLTHKRTQAHTLTHIHTLLDFHIFILYIHGVGDNSLHDYFIYEPCLLFAYRVFFISISLHLFHNPYCSKEKR